MTRVKAAGGRQEDANARSWNGVNRQSLNALMNLIELDVSGLEPPQPLMKILEAVAGLPDGATLVAHTRWRPALLYAQLEERGFTGESEEQPDGSYITHIRRR